MRLTMRSGGIAYWKTGENAGYRPDDVCFKSEVERLDKLAAFEDTELSPEEFKEKSESVLELYGKLKPYADAEEQGRLVILPCKVGDAVHYIDSGKSYKAKVSTFRFNNSGVRVYCERNFMGRIGFEGIFGKTVFLTREEAEAALKGGQDDV